MVITAWRDGEEDTGFEWVGTRDPAIMCIEQPLTTKNHLAPNVNSVKFEKS